MTPPHEQLQNGNALRFLKQYWFIVLAIIGMSMGWARFQGALASSDSVNDKQNTLIQKNMTDINELDKKYIADVSTIKAELKAINEKLDKLNR